MDGVPQGRADGANGSGRVDRVAQNLGAIDQRPISAELLPLDSLCSLSNLPRILHRVV
jgi:hypothetical protein